MGFIDFIKYIFRKRSMYSKYSKELRELVSSAHTLHLNANDFFDYASADAEMLSEYDVAQLLPLIREYGQLAINAYMAHSRGRLPLPPYCTTEFFEVLGVVKEMKWEFD